MKKLIALASVLTLSACWSGGHLNLFEWRNDFIEGLQTQSYSKISNGPKLIRSETITEKSYEPNKLATAYKGHTVASTKVYHKNYYAASRARVNVDGVVSSGNVSAKLKKNEMKDVVGVMSLEGEELYIIPTTELPRYGFLVRDDGSIHNYMVQIREDSSSVVVLDTMHIPYPENIRFEPITNASSRQTEPEKGFELKFDGIDNDMLVFTHFDYSSLSCNSGKFETILVPNQTGEVKVKKLRINVLLATDQKLEYMILED